MSASHPNALDAVHAAEPAAVSDDLLRHAVVDALADVLDPELGISVVDLGLVYGVDVLDGRVHVKLSMTTPSCPLGEQLVLDAEDRLRATDGVAAVQVEIVWEPPWGPERMSNAARQAMGWSA